MFERFWKWLLSGKVEPHEYIHITSVMLELI